jgi:ATP-dependent Clp endopeptidase proteolytic subunit ClpP
VAKNGGANRQHHHSNLLHQSSLTMRVLLTIATLASFVGVVSGYATSFVPRQEGVSSMSKSVRALSNVYSPTRASSGNKITMMPIGVPKVAYRVPGSQSADWVDIYNRLYRERIIFLGSEIDDELANQIIGVMLYLDSEDSTKPIYLYINSPGGSVISGLAIFDCMQHIKSEVITINLGLAASMGSFILAAGSKGKRLALPSSRVMIHQPMGGAQGQAEDIKVEAAQIMRIRDNLVKSYSMMTGQTTEQIWKDLDRDNFMSAYEAQEYGLIDRVLEYNKDTDTQM